MGREKGAASVQLVGRTQILQAQDSGLPLFLGDCESLRLARLRFPICHHHGPRPRSGAGSNVVLDLPG